MDISDFLIKELLFAERKFCSMAIFLLNSLKATISTIFASIVIYCFQLKIRNYYERNERKKNYLEKLREKIMQTTPKGLFTVGYDSFPDFKEVATYLYKYCSRDEKKQLKGYEKKYYFFINNGKKAGDEELNNICKDSRKFFITLIDRKLSS